MIGNTFEATLFVTQEVLFNLVNEEEEFENDVPRHRRAFAGARSSVEGRDRGRRRVRRPPQPIKAMMEPRLRFKMCMTYLIIIITSAL